MPAVAEETVDSITAAPCVRARMACLRADNNLLVRMIETFGDRDHFTHLRATCVEEGENLPRNSPSWQRREHVAVVDAISL